MYLNERQVNRANTFHVFLKHQPPEYFEEQDINPCKTCKATGLSGTSKLSDGGLMWDTTSFCSDCNGIGYKGLAGGKQIDLIHFICKQCDGIGCYKCEQKGIVDWVSNAMG